jgi:hypothetical protein
MIRNNSFIFPFSGRKGIGKSQRDSRCAFLHCNRRSCAVEYIKGPKYALSLPSFARLTHVGCLLSVFSVE